MSTIRTASKVALAALCAGAFLGIASPASARPYVRAWGVVPYPVPVPVPDYYVADGGYGYYGGYDAGPYSYDEDWDRPFGWPPRRQGPSGGSGGNDHR